MLNDFIQLKFATHFMNMIWIRHDLSKLHDKKGIRWDCIPFYFKSNKNINGNKELSYIIIFLIKRKMHQATKKRKEKKSLISCLILSKLWPAPRIKPSIIFF